ncbi:MAG: hypothetical protein Q8M56_17235, partial [Desulfobacterales bacterium]|nr:hypothetical protein [Desulfobacterales bacterium]
NSDIPRLSSFNAAVNLYNDVLYTFPERMVWGGLPFFLIFTFSRTSTIIKLFSTTSSWTKDVDQLKALQTR